MNHLALVCSADCRQYCVLNVLALAAFSLMQTCVFFLLHPQPGLTKPLQLLSEAGSDSCVLLYQPGNEPGGLLNLLCGACALLCIHPQHVMTSDPLSSAFMSPHVENSVTRYPFTAGWAEHQSQALAVAVLWLPGLCTHTHSRMHWPLARIDGCYVLSVFQFFSWE